MKNLLERALGIAARGRGFRVIVLAMLLPFLSSAAFAQDDDDDEETKARKARVEYFQKRLAEATEEFLVIYELIKIDEMETFLKLEKGQLKDGRSFVKKHAKKVAKKTADSIWRVMQNQFSSFRGPTFSIAGKNYRFEGEKEVKPKDKPLLNVTFRRMDRRLNWSMRQPSSGISSSVSISSKDAFEAQKGWRKAFAEISDSQWDEYRKYLGDKQVNLLRVAIVAQVSRKLRLDDEAKKKMAAWLGDKVKFDDRYDLSRNIKTNLGEETMKRPIPEFFSDAQKAKWKIMQSNDEFSR